MRTIYPMMVVLALGIAAVMFGMSGYSDLYEQDPTAGLESGGEVNETANNSAIKDDSQFGGSSVSSGDGDIVGLILAGLERLVSIASLVVLLPAEMRDLGFPWWFSLPVGLLMQTIMGIGIIQFASGRFLR
jgi:hypothetical protein